MDHEQPHQELVKCVVVGDTAVGKTRLICARACNSRLDMGQLMTTHIPTVWAIDQYRIHKEVLERSCEIVDGVNVSLRLWDTFGDHDKDRRFAYGRSDVVLLCFSIANPNSLRNCKSVWYPEIRRFCPNTPIVLVGCKNDLRFMFRDEKFLNLCREKSPFFRPLRESDILTPDVGRAVAKDLGAPYYETSVFTHFGVNQVFENVIRVALLARRQQRWMTTNLKHVQKATIQEPFCPPEPLPPKLTIPESQYLEDLRQLLESETCTDLILTCSNVRIKDEIHGHRLVLAAGSDEFLKLLTSVDINHQHVNHQYLNPYSSPFNSASGRPSDGGLSLTSLTRSASDSSIASSADTSIGVGSFPADTENLLSGSPNSGQNFDMLGPATPCTRPRTSTMIVTQAAAQSTVNSMSAALGNCCALRSFKLPRPFSPSSDPPYLVFSQATAAQGNSQLGSGLRRRASITLHPESSSPMRSSFKVNQHPLFVSVNMEPTDLFSDSRSSAQMQTIVTINPKHVTFDSLRRCIYFIYTGAVKGLGRNNFLSANSIATSDIFDAAQLLNIFELQDILRKADMMGDVIHPLDQDAEDGSKIQEQFIERLKNQLYKIGLEQKLFTDVVFQLDDGTFSAHKSILMVRCEMFDAMFRGHFRESSQKVVPFPGVKKETFRQLMHYLYTDSVDAQVNLNNCISLLEVANRLCLSRLIALIEAQIINELKKLASNDIEAAEHALRLLEPCQIHNADQLADWCLYQISIHYNDISHKNPKLLRNLHPENQAYLNRNRWPPVWYLKEFDYYERCVREKQRLDNPPKGLKRHRLNTGCLCFSTKSRRRSKSVSYMTTG